MVVRVVFNEVFVPKPNNIKPKKNSLSKELELQVTYARCKKIRNGRLELNERV